MQYGWTPGSESRMLVYAASAEGGSHAVQSCLSICVYLIWAGPVQALRRDELRSRRKKRSRSCWPRAEASGRGQRECRCTARALRTYLVKPAR